MTPLEHLGLAIGIVVLIVWWIFHDAWHDDEGFTVDNLGNQHRNVEAHIKTVQGKAELEATQKVYEDEIQK